MSNLFGSDLEIINVGISEFTKSIIEKGAKVLNVAWSPPGGNEEVARSLSYLVNRPEVEKANTTAFAQYLSSKPCLVGLGPAKDVIPDLPERVILHAGPPILWENMCEPVKGAIIGACIFERWAENYKTAERLINSGEISFAPCHHYNAVGPMAGIISPSMPVWIIEDSTRKTRAYSNLNEGLGKVLRFGANAPDVIEHLHWMQNVLAPALKVILERLGPIELKPLMAMALHMGDEIHNRNAAASALFIKHLIPAALDAKLDNLVLSEVVKFINSNDHFFLNLSMSACKAMMNAAHGVPGSSLVTAMARNGVDFGIRVSGLGDKWYTSPAPLVNGLFFPGYSAEDANPDLGDSCITETAGIGAFAMAASPAIVQFVGGSASDAVASTRQMEHITFSKNDAFTLPQLDFSATPAGIDIRKVIDTGITPIINTGIAHREAGVGQIGAGITRAPIECFSQAIIELSEFFNMSSEI